MNDKLINSLMWKAGAKFEMMNWVHYDDFDYEKFAKLIVEECVKVCTEGQQEEHVMGLIYSKKIKRHFGVE